MKKILILSANPINTSKLRLDEEVREIQSALERSRSREEFQLITKGAVRIDDLRSALLDEEPQIVHFSGHGDGTDGIALEDNSGHAQLISTESLSNLFKLFKDPVECVLLNACYSETQAEAIYQHINCVIGMAHSITDKAAIYFSKAFYDALGAGRSYKEAFDFGCNNIDLNSIPESLTPKIKIRNNFKTLFSKKQSTIKSMKQQPSQSFTIKNGQFSGVQIGQASGNLTQSQQNTQNTAEKQLTSTEVVELIAQIEFLFLNSNLSDVSKKQALKHLDYAKDAVQEEQPDKIIAAKSLQKATQVLKEANEMGVGQGLWQKLEPITKQLAPWLGIATKSLI
jgi:CHAT domain